MSSLYSPSHFDCPGPYGHNAVIVGQALAVLCKLARTPATRVPLTRAAPTVAAVVLQARPTPEPPLVLKAMFVLNAIAAAGRCRYDVRVRFHAPWVLGAPRQCPSVSRLSVLPTGIHTLTSHTEYTRHTHADTCHLWLSIPAVLQ